MTCGHPYIPWWRKPCPKPMQSFAWRRVISVRGWCGQAILGVMRDTIAAVFGAFSGAYQGETVIPEAWIEKVRRPSGVCLKFASQVDMRELALQLVELN